LPPSCRAFPKIDGAGAALCAPIAYHLVQGLIATDGESETGLNVVPG
jgi:hypothetical protein